MYKKKLAAEFAIFIAVTGVIVYILMSDERKLLSVMPTSQNERICDGSSVERPAGVPESWKRFDSAFLITLGIPCYSLWIPSEYTVRSAMGERGLEFIEHNGTILAEINFEGNRPFLDDTCFGSEKSCLGSMDFETFAIERGKDMYLADGGGISLVARDATDVESFESIAGARGIRFFLTVDEFSFGHVLKASYRRGPIFAFDASKDPAVQVLFFIPIHWRASQIRTDVFEAMARSVYVE